MFERFMKRFLTDDYVKARTNEAMRRVQYVLPKDHYWKKGN